MATEPDRKCMELRGTSEQGEFLGCLNGRDTFEDERVTKAYRKVKLLTGVVVVLCAITLLATGSSVYLYYKIAGLSSEMKALSMQSEDSDYYYDAEYLTGDLDYPADSPSSDETEDGEKSKERRKKGKKTNRGCKGGKREKSACKCCVRKIRSLAKAGEFSIQPATKPTPTKLTTPINFPKGIDQKEIAAAHYSSFVNNAYIGEIFPPIDRANLAATVNQKSIPKWGGVLIRNSRHFELKNASTINMLKEVPWMVNKTKIFDFDENTGEFMAKQNGVYLLYAHVMFYNVSKNQSMAILHKRIKDRKVVEINRMRCEEIIKPINPDAQPIESNNYKPCSVDGTLYLKRGDSVQVQSLFPDSIIDLSKDVTYFGGVLVYETVKDRDSDRS